MMGLGSKKTPEEIEALKAKYGDNSEKKAAKKALKSQYENKNLKVVEIRVPIEIDLEKPPWDSHVAALEYGWRVGQFLREGIYPTEEVKRKVIRT